MVKNSYIVLAALTAALIAGSGSRTLAQSTVPTKPKAEQRIATSSKAANDNDEEDEEEDAEPIHYVERDLNIFAADEIYGEWNSIFLTPASIPKDRLPEVFHIDLTGFVFPHDGRITSGFGVRSKKRNHYGVDISTQFGDAVKASFDGRVRITGYDKRGFGYYVVVRHANGLETIYAHLAKPIVQKNQDVVAGQVIAKTGKTGRMTGSVLHFEVRFLGTPFNPQLFFDFKEKRLLAETFTYKKKNHNPIPRVKLTRSRIL